jgi:hypothetical protein
MLTLTIRNAAEGAAVHRVNVTALIAFLPIALLPVAAHAQSNPALTTSIGQRSGYHSYKEYKPRHQKELEERIRDKPYQDALRSIPNSRAEPDPWKDAR